MKKTTRSLMEELNSIHKKNHNGHIIENRAMHIIAGAANLINLIKESYNPDQAYELERRLINSIRANDPNKFVRSIRKIRENTEVALGLKVITGDVKSDDD